MQFRKVIRLGNSIAVTMPKSMLEAAGMQVGGIVELRFIQPEQIVIRPYHQESEDKTKGEKGKKHDGTKKG